MDDLPLPQEFDHIIHIRIIRQPQNVVIGDPCLLLSRQILGQIRNGVTLDLDTGCSPGESGCGGGVYTYRVVNKIFVKAAFFNLLFGSVFS